MGADFLKRYEAGQHEDVWRELGALSTITDPDLDAEAHAVARATMTRVRRNAERLWETLSERDDELELAVDFPPGEDVSRGGHAVGAPVPAATIAARLSRWTPLPAALQAFWEIVGHLDFIGCAGDDEHAWPDDEQLDALQIYSPFAPIHEPDDPDPEHIVITLDACMKARVGGTGPIVARTGRTADSALFFEGAPLRDFDGRPGVTFVSYLRIGFSRGGFYGLDPTRDAKLIAMLTRGFEPF